MYSSDDDLDVVTLQLINLTLSSASFGVGPNLLKPAAVCSVAKFRQALVTISEMIQENLLAQGLP